MFTQIDLIIIMAQLLFWETTKQNFDNIAKNIV